MDAELDALDRACNLAIGWTDFPYMMHPPQDRLMVPPGERPHVSTLRPAPSPTRVPADFVALMLWHAREGRRPDVSAVGMDGLLWESTIWRAPGEFVSSGHQPCPMVALARATAEWAKGRGK